MKKRFVSLIGVALILCMFASAASAETKIKLNTSWGENSSVQTAALRFGELLAEKSGGFHYEMICDIGKRIPRVYLKDGKVVGTKDYFDDVFKGFE